jgi:DNA-directed RNA polymerase alpha subunit
MATEVNPIDHHPHHQGVTMQCPVSCLGVRTVADLVNLLATTTRAVLPDAYPSTRPELDEIQEHDDHTPHCPLSCLNLSTRTANALRYNSTETWTIADLVRMIRSGQLSRVRNIGRRSLTEIHTALVAAGIDVQHTNLT